MTQAPHGPVAQALDGLHKEDQHHHHGQHDVGQKALVAIANAQVAQTAAAHGLCRGVPAERAKHIDVAGAGHYGIFSGRRWREVVYPEVRGFIREHA